MIQTLHIFPVANAKFIEASNFGLMRLFVADILDCEILVNPEVR